MNNKRKTLMILVMTLAFSNLPLMAHEGHEKDEAKSIEKAASLPSIWKSIKEEEQELEKTISAGKLEQVHEIAFSIRDQAKLLLENQWVSPEFRRAY